MNGTDAGGLPPIFDRRRRRPLRDLDLVLQLPHALRQHPHFGVAQRFAGFIARRFACDPFAR